MGKDGARIQKDTVTTDRHDDRNSSVDELVTKVFDLADSSPDVIVCVHHFVDPCRQRLHVAARHSAVGV